MAKFRLAVNRQRQSGTDFVDVIAWRRAAEVCSDYLKKGILVLVEGRIQIRSFEDQAGQRRWATEVVARNVQMLDKSQVAETQNPQPETNEELVDDTGLESDLPF
jgi:single-strand DNA-binding protein